MPQRLTCGWPTVGVDAQERGDQIDEVGGKVQVRGGGGAQVLEVRGGEAARGLGEEAGKGVVVEGEDAEGKSVEDDT